MAADFNDVISFTGTFAIADKKGLYTKLPVAGAGGVENSLTDAKAMLALISAASDAVAMNVNANLASNNESIPSDSLGNRWSSIVYKIQSDPLTGAGQVSYQKIRIPECKITKAELVTLAASLKTYVSYFDKDTDIVTVHKIT